MENSTEKFIEKMEDMKYIKQYMDEKFKYTVEQWQEKKEKLDMHYQEMNRFLEAKILGFRQLMKEMLATGSLCEQNMGVAEYWMEEYDKYFNLKISRHGDI